MQGALACFATVITACWMGLPVHASVFQDWVRWPIIDGYAIIPVCIVSGSSVEQTKGAVIHDQNPSLAAVIGRVRYALSNSWEKHSAVRFVGWKNCDDLSDSEKAGAVGLHINKDDENNSYVGTVAKGKFPGSPVCRACDVSEATSFKPWGRDARCISYNILRARREYQFDCVEQYAIHEFGHVIGFLHEWLHPLKPQECTPPGETPIASVEAATTFVSPASYTVVNLDLYDRDSIMVYNDDESICADVTGVRFGSENLSDFDKLGVEEVYPPPVLGVNDVGIIPNSADDCPDGKLVTVHLDNEDDNNNNKKEGWIGAIEQDQNTKFQFCRVDGNKFGRLKKPESGNAHYAVIQLGESCPEGAFPFLRYHDDQDYPPLNENWMSGETGPNFQEARKGSEGGDGTALYFCFFPHQEGTPHIDGMPDLGYGYGVIANSEFSEAIETGSIYTDDEDNGEANRNRLEAPPGSSDSSQLALIEQVLEKGGNNGNTKYFLAHVNVTKQMSTPTPINPPTTEPTIESTPAATNPPTTEMILEPNLTLTNPPTIEMTLEPNLTLTNPPTIEMTLEPTPAPTNPPTAKTTLEPTPTPTNRPPVPVGLEGSYQLSSTKYARGCIEPRTTGNKLILATCNSKRIWRLEQVGGATLFHSSQDYAKCMQAGYGDKIEDGTKMRLLPCDKSNGFQLFTWNGAGLIKISGRDDMCVVFRGVRANYDSDPIILSSCEKVEARIGWDGKKM